MKIWGIKSEKKHSIANTFYILDKGPQMKIQISEKAKAKAIHPKIIKSVHCKAMMGIFF